MAALARDLQQTGAAQARQVGAGGRRRHSALERQLGGGEGAALHQRGEHARPGGITEQAGDGGDVGDC